MSERDQAGTDRTVDDDDANDAAGHDAAPSDDVDGGSQSGRAQPDTTQPVTAQAVSASRVIDAPASAIFAVLADPNQHPLIDGSGTVRASRTEAAPLTLGARFGMRMRLGPLPYLMSNTVVEFEPNRLIAWRHYGRHRWRYALEPIDDDTTRVTETFDWSTAPRPARWAMETAGYPERNRRAIEATLDRLAAAVTR